MSRDGTAPGLRALWIVEDRGRPLH